MLKIGILPNGASIIGDEQEDGRWNDPCFIYTKKDESGSFAIRFDPLIMFSNNRSIEMNKDKFIAFDQPSEDIARLWENFVERFQSNLKQTSEGKKQETRTLH